MPKRLLDNLPKMMEDPEFATAWEESKEEFSAVSKTVRNGLALERAQKAFEGVADQLGLKTEQDVVDMVNEVRKEMNQDRHAGSD